MLEDGRVLADGISGDGGIPRARQHALLAVVHHHLAAVRGRRLDHSQLQGLQQVTSHSRHRNNFKSTMIYSQF